ncbi:DUF1573 domain-containing protein [Pinibacter soli]|uniref:DUF1573 domain-containing protein n=1 Tax=Pinibacter soli TaxID=3044211 RepID=A0ABT6RHY3_9BACT|nr:DUF1573 domain-containing protein [Pinibacter soli]MDI3322175.1 DUF1573 domain-containing protein [Pinibacter soli]
MKKIALLSVFSLMLSVFAFAQTTSTVPTKKADELVKFAETRHDFGKIKQGVPVTYDFAFKNIASAPVVIESATASCGCTTPVKPEKPVAKGKSDVVKAGFNAAAAGPFEKTIFVKVAGADQPLELKIAGQVLSADDFAKYEAEKAKGK